MSNMDQASPEHRQQALQTAASQGSRPARHATDDIYLDYAATTPVAPEVADEMAGYLTIDGIFGNPSSITHRFGHEALEAVDSARKAVAQLIAATPGEIVFTSGATEAINLAICGVMLSSSTTKNGLLVSALEHKAVLDTAAFLQKHGIDLTIMSPDASGLITPELVDSNLRENTALVSLMLVNNETGTFTDIAAISQIVRNAGALIHVDASQAIARMPLDVNKLGVDLISLSGHKFYGPKGVGALYIRRRVQPQLLPHTHGGGQEAGLRPGTLATHQIVGLGAAAKVVANELDTDMQRIQNLDQRLFNQLNEIDNCALNGNPDMRLPGILNIAFSNVSAESLMLSMPNVAVSTGSACTSAEVKPSHVLLALDIDEETSLSSIRFSLGRYTTAQEIDAVAQRVRSSVSDLRRIAA